MDKYSATRRADGRTWLSVIVGAVSIVVGVWCLFTPGATFAALIIVFIAGFFAAGAVNIISAFASRGSGGWGWRLASGVVETLLGIWLCAMPAATASTALVYVAGFYILVYSVVGIAVAGRLGRVGARGWGWMLALNIIGLTASLLFLLSPTLFGGLILTWLVGLAFISYGLTRLMSAAA